MLFPEVFLQTHQRLIAVLERFKPDLYVPGNPVHPLTFIHGVMALLGRYRK